MRPSFLLIALSMPNKSLSVKILINLPKYQISNIIHTIKLHIKYIFAIWTLKGLYPYIGQMLCHYWMHTWREGRHSRNVHLGSCAKMDAQVALQKAKAMKADALGIKI